MKKLAIISILTLVAGPVLSATILVPSEQPTVQAGIDEAIHEDN